jgi:hypothetical protein
LAHARHDDVGRGADQRHDAAKEGTERHGHQQGRTARFRYSRELEGDWHQHGERADILDEARKRCHGTDECDDLLMDGDEMSPKLAHDALDDA